MKYWNSYDIYWDTYIDKWYEQVVPLFEKYLEGKNYSPYVESLDTIINCSPSTDFKVRSKFNKKNKVLFFDIVISYEEYMVLPSELEKKNKIAVSFLEHLEVLKKFKTSEFDFERLKQDCVIFFQNIGWLL